MLTAMAYAEFAQVYFFASGPLASSSKVEFLDRVGLGPVGPPGKEARHGQSDVASVFRLAQRSPPGILGDLEDLGQVTRVG
jgi:hypothetical protein